MSRKLSNNILKAGICSRMVGQQSFATVADALSRGPGSDNFKLNWDDVVSSGLSYEVVKNKKTGGPVLITGLPVFFTSDARQAASLD